jgi:hypothetical protein
MLLYSVKVAAVCVSLDPFNSIELVLLALLHSLSLNNMHRVLEFNSLLLLIYLEASVSDIRSVMILVELLMRAIIHI